MLKTALKCIFMHLICFQKDNIYLMQKICVACGELFWYISDNFWICTWEIFKTGSSVYNDQFCAGRELAIVITVFEKQALNVGIKDLLCTYKYVLS